MFFGEYALGVGFIIVGLISYFMYLVIPHDVSDKKRAELRQDGYTQKQIDNYYPVNVGLNIGRKIAGGIMVVIGALMVLHELFY